VPPLRTPEYEVPGTDCRQSIEGGFRLGWIDIHRCPGLRILIMRAIFCICSVSHTFKKSCFEWLTCRSQPMRPVRCRSLLGIGILGDSLFGVADAGNAGLDPSPSQKPHFDDLRKAHVPEQREHQDWPVHPRQVREAQRRCQRRIRQPNPKSHNR